MRGRSSSNIELFDLSALDNEEDRRRVVENQQETFTESVLNWITIASSYVCYYCRRSAEEERHPEEEVGPVVENVVSEEVEDDGFSSTHSRRYKPPRPRSFGQLSSAESSVFIGGNSEGSSPTTTSRNPGGQRERWIMRRGELVKETIPSGPPPPGFEEGEEGYVATFLENLDLCRGPVKTVKQLSTLLELCGPHIPARLEIEAMSHTVAGVDGASLLPYRLNVFGPLRAVPHPEVLSIVEDILLEDCQDALVAAGLVCSDISFNRRNHYLFSPEKSTPDAPMHTLVTSGSNAFLDQLGLLTTDASPPVKEGNRKESATRLLSFLKTLTESSREYLRDYSFIRCDFTPFDLEPSVPIPSLFPPLESLSFSHCPLTVSHLTALLEWARRENKEEDHQGKRQSLQSLQILQICGSLTPSSIEELLDFFQDEIDGAQLRVLRVPSQVVAVARGHTFSLTNPSFRVEEISPF